MTIAVDMGRKATKTNKQTNVKLSYVSDFYASPEQDHQIFPVPIQGAKLFVHLSAYVQKARSHAYMLKGPFKYNVNPVNECTDQPVCNAL